MSFYLLLLAGVGPSCRALLRGALLAWFEAINVDLFVVYSQGELHGNLDSVCSQGIDVTRLCDVLRLKNWYEARPRTSK